MAIKLNTSLNDVDDDADVGATVLVDSITILLLSLLSITDWTNEEATMSRALLLQQLLCANDH